MARISDRQQGEQLLNWPGVSVGLQVVVEAAEAVLVERFSQRLVVAFPVVLQVVQQISIAAKLEDQVYGP